MAPPSWTNIPISFASTASIPSFSGNKFDSLSLMGSTSPQNPVFGYLKSINPGSSTSITIPTSMGISQRTGLANYTSSATWFSPPPPAPPTNFGSW